MTPSICRNAASTPQKQPAPNVAFSMFVLFKIAAHMWECGGSRSIAADAVVSASVADRGAGRTTSIIRAVEYARHDGAAMGRIIACAGRRRTARRLGADEDCLGGSPGRLWSDLVPHLIEQPRRVGRQREGFGIDGVREPLVVDARRIDGFGEVHVMIDDIGDRLEGDSDDPRTARTADDHEDLAVAQGNGRAHRAQWPLARSDRIGCTLDEAKHVRYARLRGEVVHLVVEE